MDAATVIGDHIKTILSETDVFRLLNNRNSLIKLFKNFCTGENYLYDSLLPELITGFSAKYPNELKSFLNSRSNLISIVLKFIHYIQYNNLSEYIRYELKKCNASACEKNEAELPDLVPLVEDMISKLNFSNEIKIFGFGLGDGSYENDIKQFLLETNKCRFVKIYGYDPYTCSSSDYTVLSKNDLTSKKYNDFDLLIARWTLHHVITEERWGDFINSMNLLKPSGSAIIIEHGFLNEKDSLYNNNLYLLLNGIMDLIGNIYFNNDWIEKTVKDNDYFLEFITTEDIHRIADRCLTPRKWKIYNTAPIFPYNSVIHLY